MVPGTVYSAGLSCGDMVKTANGQSVKITKMFGKSQPLNSTDINTFSCLAKTNGKISSSL